MDAAFIKNGAITAAKIADATTTAAKISDAAITSAKIADASITTAKIGSAAVQTLRIASGALTSMGYRKGGNGTLYYQQTLGFVAYVFLTMTANSWGAGVIATENMGGQFGSTNVRFTISKCNYNSNITTLLSSVDVTETRPTRDRLATRLRIG